MSILDGEDLAPAAARPAGPVDIGAFHFPGLPTRTSLPAVDMHYISFTLAGSLTVERDLGRGRERAEFRPGKSLILPAHTQNAWSWNGATDELHLYVSPAWLSTLAATVGVAAPKPIERFAFEDPLLHSLASALLDDRRHGGVGGTLFRETTSELIGLRLLRAHCAVGNLPPSRASLAPAALRRVRELIEERLDDDLSLDDLAAAAGLSRAHFARTFHRTTGVTPYAYLRGRRVERAKEMLAGPGAALTDVAVACGFRSQSHFGRVFRRATGLTPADYRRVAQL